MTTSRKGVTRRATSNIDVRPARQWQHHAVHGMTQGALAPCSSAMRASHLAPPLARMRGHRLEPFFSEVFHTNRNFALRPSP